MPPIDRIGVHHPRHDLLVGADVRGGDIGGWPDQRHDFAGIATRDAFEFFLGVVRGVEPHPALGAPVWDVEERALPRHPHRQGAYLVEVDVWAVANTALAGSAGEIVLNAVPNEHFHFAAVTAQRHADGYFSAGRRQHAVHAFVVAEEVYGVA